MNSKDGFYIYRCRNCNVVYQLDYLKDNLKKELLRSMDGKNNYMFHIHDCNEGQLGMAELIGGVFQ